jgi:predicted GNAT superfamily acetyltransferase
MTEKQDVVIRPLHTMEEMQPAVALQRTYWGDDSEAVIPAHMLFSLANAGGHVLAAFDGDRMVGVLVGFLGTNSDEPDRPAIANLHIISKRMIVLDGYRGAGIGYRLKLAQREVALRQGVRMVTWTFDPLLAQNAHLNIRKLGAVCTEFRENYYGLNPSTGLARGGSSDRLVVEWWVTHRRVEERLFGSRSDLTLAQYLEADTVIVNPAQRTDDGAIIPAESGALPATSLALLEIPPNYPAIEQGNPTLAKAWRDHIRYWFTVLLARSFIVTDFIRTTHEGRERTLYLLSYNGPQFESFTTNTTIN